MQLLDLVEYTRIVNEASIFSRGTYTYGHKVKLSTSVKGEALLRAIQKEIPDFDPTEELTWLNPALVMDVDSLPTVVLGKGSKKSDRKIFKTDSGLEFAIQGAVSAIETGMIHAGRFNRGDMAEACLGAALTAKLVLRGGKKIGDIDSTDVTKVLKKAVKGTVIIKAPDLNNLVSDKIVFKLRLPTGSQEQLAKMAKFEKIQDLIDASVDFANSADAERYSNYFYLNGKVDEVRIESDGVSSQKGTKTDVKAVVTTKDPDTGEIVERTLKNVDISLKADSIKYGQHSAGGLTKGSEVWLASAKRLFEPLGIVLDMPARGKNDILKFWTAIYRQVVEKLNKQLADASFAKETIFVEKIADLINAQGSGSSKTIRLISFEKGKSSIHSFNIVKQKLIDRKIDLRAKLSIGPRSGKPTIHIYDAHNVTGSGLLTNIRFYLTETASTNYFEKGPLLHELTRVEKTASVRQDPNQQPTQQTTQGPARSIMKPVANTPPQPTANTTAQQIDHPADHITLDQPKDLQYSN